MTNPVVSTLDIHSAEIVGAAGSSEVPELAVSQRVMNRQVGHLLDRRRCPDHVHDLHVLGVAACDRIDRAQLTHPEGGTQRAQAAQRQG